MFCLLHLYVDKASCARGGEDIQDHLLAAGGTHRYGLVEGEGEVLYSVVALQMQDSVQKILEGTFAVKEFLEAGVVSRVQIDLPLQRFGDRSLADGFGFSLLVFSHSVLIRVRPGVRRGGIPRTV